MRETSKAMSAPRQEIVLKCGALFAHSMLPRDLSSADPRIISTMKTTGMRVFIGSVKMNPKQTTQVC